MCSAYMSVVGQQDITLRSEVEHILEIQASAWNQGDLDRFMKTYWENDALLFMGKAGPTYGYLPTLANYHKRYPNRQAMGHLTFDVLSVTPQGRKVATLVGRYHLQRQDLDNLEGHFLLVLRKIKNHWKIVADSTH